MTETQTYKPDRLIAKVEVPETITPLLESDEKVVRVARHIYEADKGSSHKLPSEYSALEDLFWRLYNRSYREMRDIDVVPVKFDLLFQQYCIKKDEELGKNGLNTFGLFVLSYMDGLATAPNPSERYFGAKEDPRYRRHYRGLLLGCSSISSAEEFTTFMKAINPQATAIIADIDPLAVKLAKDSGATVIQADAQRIPLEDMGVDFVATNFLIPHLIDRLGSGRGTIQEVLREVSRVLRPQGRLVMVEPLSRINRGWLVYYTGKVDLALAMKGSGWENKAIILNNRDTFGRVVGGIPNFIRSEAAWQGGKMSSSVPRLGRELDGVASLVFEESKWSKRKGWEKKGTVVVRSSKGEIG